MSLSKNTMLNETVNEYTNVKANDCPICGKSVTTQCYDCFDYLDMTPYEWNEHIENYQNEMEK